MSSIRLDEVVYLDGYIVPHSNVSKRGKQRRNSEVTKAKILDAAVEQFAQYSLQGVLSSKLKKLSI